MVTNPFELQAAQIAALGAWNMVTGGRMTKKMEQVSDTRWEWKTGLFVTLYKEGAIRGSMGLLESDQTLAETLFEVGGTAATHDDRYSPIEHSELQSLTIHVTILSQFSKMNSPTDIQIGSTGIAITRGNQKAILLPKVAVDNKWTEEMFLEACCEKAQLSHKAWKDPNTLVEIFTTYEIDAGPLIPLISEYIRKPETAVQPTLN
ncbi:MAG: AmmeMemoRadiSam system protein A [Oligoflexia bacterium]|nr:AmmeMemoRadiSam system protein A [Oligoflexia bacterium]